MPLISEQDAEFLRNEFETKMTNPVKRVVDGEEKDFGIRFFGIPSGYEFTSVIEDIADVSRGKVDLQDKTREVLAGLTEPVHMQVFVTPTCPYCPRAVRLAHMFAIASDLVRGDMVEAMVAKLLEAVGS